MKKKPLFDVPSPAVARALELAPHECTAGKTCEVCTCASFFTVRGEHKKDCPMKKDCGCKNGWCNLCEKSEPYKGENYRKGFLAGSKEGFRMGFTAGLRRALEIGKTMPAMVVQGKNVDLYPMENAYIKKTDFSSAITKEIEKMK